MSNENDPWEEARWWLERCRTTTDLATKRQIALVCYLNDEIDRLTKRVKELERHVATAVQAGNLYRQASYQSHSGHWDSTMQGGKGCPECIRANDLRKEADELMDQERFPDLKERKRGGE